MRPNKHRPTSSRRLDALEAVERHHADRVVIATQQSDDEELLGLVRASKSIGMPVSPLPHPRDLLEAPTATANAVGGMPLAEIEALPTHAATSYSGPQCRRDRKARVSVVVPARNEEANVGLVLTPPGLHEVILVDGNSEDETIAVALWARSDIRVLTQGGRGKGDVLRTAFAAATGNLV